MLYLPDPDPARRVLHLTLASGVSREFAAPWSRVALDDPIPVADAVREGRLVWLSGQEETARRYPRLGLVLPYDFALAAAPLTAETPDQPPADPAAAAAAEPSAAPAAAPDAAAALERAAALAADRATTPTAESATPAAHGPATAPANESSAARGAASATAPAAELGADLAAGPAAAPATDPAAEAAVGGSAVPAGAGVVFLWPGSHEPRLTGREQRALEAACGRLGGLLLRAAAEGRPIRPAAHPGILRPLPPPTPGPAEAAAAMAFIRRLPGGNCALDLNGTITFITPEAAALVGAPASALLGALPWEALPWMDTPVIEDHYRAVAISRLPRSFTTPHPAGRRLRFDLYPDDTGISVRITLRNDQPATPVVFPQTAPAEPAPSRATALYPLMLLAATLTEAAHAQDVVEKAADQLVPSLGAHAMALLVEEDGRLRIVGHRGYPAELMARHDGTPVRADTPTTHILRTATPLFFGDIDELRAVHPDVVIESGMAAWAFLPLIASKRTVGCLVLAYAHPHTFAPGERAVLTSIAGLIAQALDRARLYDSTHQLAHSLQTGLLPRALPRIPRLEVAARYLPAAHGLDIGGDFYDLIRIDGTTVAATVGDVQGHNVNAAALMGQVRTAVHASAGAHPAEVLARTNRLVSDLEAGLFTSCVYAHIDLAGQSVRLASAGHPPPLLRHADGRTEMLRLPAGLLLGVDPEASYTAVEVPFVPGALLALYTDGLVEVPGRDIEEAIGELADRIAEAPGRRPLGDLADELIEGARRGAPRTDDIALLLLRSERP
ncbi:SpoIIE family protein phosphatase [Streptomyces sp. NBC_01565]|nr:SpoIIE family protein phosphatase [Streptomyces sp. NBC_01565]MCX4539479.1 SpoIIE family protein phosphatase [Streptomyces sp. NBC_01565]